MKQHSSDPERLEPSRQHASPAGVIPTVPPPVGRTSRILMTLAIIVAIGAIFTLIGRASFFNRPQYIPPVAYAGPVNVKVGDRLIVIDPRTFVGTDIVSVKAYTKAFDDEDRDAMRSIIREERGFTCAMGHQVEVLKVAPEYYKIRILPGSSHKGKEGYTLPQKLGTIQRNDVLVPEAIASIPVETREQIYTEAMRVELKMSAEVHGKYAHPKTQDKESRSVEMERLQARETELVNGRERVKAETAKKFNISVQQLTFIMNEGYEKSWPIPDVSDFTPEKD